MRYKPYPKYKESGVAWLGEVPEGWEVKKTKHCFNLIVNPAPKNNNYELLSIYTDIGVKPRKELEAKGNKSSTTDGYWIVKKGDLIVNKLLAWMGAIGYSNYNGVTSPAYDILRANKDINSQFYAYLFRTKIAQQEFKRWSRGIMEMRLRLYFSEFGNIPIPLPSIEEQNRIVNYIEEKTQKIDTLIEKQQTLIKLLKEKRQALISHAVTKGLDDSVEMKDSGVAWLGDVPEEWIVTKIKNMLSTPITDGPHETPIFLNEGVPFVSAEAISKGFINFNKIRGHISLLDNKKYSQKYSPKLHDVYMIKSGATTGVTAIVEDRIDFNIWSPLAVFRANQKLNPFYLLNYLRSSNFQIAVELYWSYGTQQNIGMNVLENLYIAIPPIQEQKAIAQYLDQKTKQIDTLISKSTQAIELLKERRSALISAVLTGKVDVREDKSV